MKARLWIILVGLAVSGANVALAARATSQAAKAFQCSDEGCVSGSAGETECKNLGCDGCTDFPVGHRCYKSSQN